MPRPRFLGRTKNGVKKLEKIQQEQAVLRQSQEAAAKTEQVKVQAKNKYQKRVGQTVETPTTPKTPPVTPPPPKPKPETKVHRGRRRTNEERRNRAKPLNDTKRAGSAEIPLVNGQGSSTIPEINGTTSIDHALLDEIDLSRGLVGRVGAVGSTLFNSAKTYFREEGTLKSAWQGTVKASAISAGGHAGVAVLEGDDPWEAAKTGALRGAMAGAGYQGLKAATYAPKGIGIKDGVKHIKKNVGQVYQAHTFRGQTKLREQGGATDSLKRILQANAGEKQGIQQSGLYKQYRGLV